MKIMIGIRIEPDLKEKLEKLADDENRSLSNLKLEKLADDENRSLSNFIVNATLTYIKEHKNVDLKKSKK
jgi:predicted transcriptional regulator